MRAAMAQAFELLLQQMNTLLVDEGDAKERVFRALERVADGVQERTIARRRSRRSRRSERHRERHAAPRSNTCSLCHCSSAGSGQSVFLRGSAISAPFLA